VARAYECGRGVEQDRTKATLYYSGVSSDPNHQGNEHSVDLQNVARAGLSRLLTWKTAERPDWENRAEEGNCRWSLWDTNGVY
jgi:hypothetical protein